MFNWLMIFSAISAVKYFSQCFTRASPLAASVQSAKVGIIYDSPPDKIEKTVEIILKILDNHEGMDPELPPRAYFEETCLLIEKKPKQEDEKEKS